MQGLNISKLIPWKALAGLGVGVALLSWWIYYQGMTVVTDRLIDGLTVFPLVAVLSFFYLFLQTFAWQLTIATGARSFWSLVRFEAAGNALRSLHPFALVGGDALQGHLLRKSQGITSAAPSIVTDRALHLIAMAIVGWVGLVAGALNSVELPIWLRIGLPVLAVGIGFFLVISVYRSKAGLFNAIVDSLPSFGKSCACQSPAVRGRLNEYDRLVSAFYLENRGAFYQSLILHLISEGMLFVEIYLIGSVVLPGFSVAMALLLTALTPLLQLAFRCVPGAIGVMEISFALLLGLGIGPEGWAAGTALVLIRRLRSFVWIVVGLIFGGNPFAMFLRKS